MRNWAQHNPDILEEIARRITLYEDFLVFGGVCNSWRSAAQKENFRFISRQVPYLMLPHQPTKRRGGGGGGIEDKLSELRAFFSLARYTTRYVYLPEAKGKRCLSSKGWLITIAKDLSMTLLHPFTRLQIKLPHIKSLRNWKESAVSIMYTMFIHKCLLSSNPSLTPDYITMIIYGGCGDIAYCRPGHEKWTTIETGGLTFFDMTYFKGTVYAIDCKGRIIACDLRGDYPIAKQVTELPQKLLKKACDYLYILESSGELLVISREGVSIHPITEGSDDYTYGTYEFRVFKVDIISTMTITWMEIKDLGNRALFLGYNSSVSIEASNFYKPNCIYFTDDCMGSYWEDEKGEEKIWEYITCMMEALPQYLLKAIHTALLIQQCGLNKVVFNF
ncbi:hypothetical protein EZV62_022980 [Acer yangbiense]|uniref:KIB1-4 beta-propeller domain-containing protein n=1 Tax=Acer yangbiense TaxID=1000413 RepID=A0A5C7H2F3_9ROSI|nr:hypothetical protein EZV62_022980 [Acer yangbiense]